jgi:hypothetical protein
MTATEAYLDVANRYISSCEEHITNNIDIQEVLGFKSYHAFESVGGAFNSYRGETIPRRHQDKINLFVLNARREGLPNQKAIATIAILLNSLRNKCLYPDFDGTNYISTQDQISLSDAKNLVRRVKGIITTIERQV